MQIVLHVMARPKLKRSLREVVIEDLQRIDDYNLDVTYEKRKGRPGGWAKVQASDLDGVINVSWDPHSKTLTARAIARQGNSPSELVGRFVYYLLDQRKKDIAGISMRAI
jgi:hypothetical protein